VTSAKPLHGALPALIAPPARVLLIEDEPDLREAIAAYLSLEAMQVSGVGTLADANAWAAENDFDILILDLGLPDGDGVSWLESLPSLGTRGVVILTARGSPAQRLTGLRAGADAYLVKPIALEELALTVRKLFARIQVTAPAPLLATVGSPRTEPAIWQLNAQTWMLTAPNGKSLLLKHSERLLLEALLGPAGEVLSKDRVVASQGAKADGFDYRRIETLIRRLRLRCRDALDTELPVQTIYGRGLAFTEAGVVVRETGRPPTGRR